MKSQKLICFTLDLEKDYGRFDTYHSFKNIDLLLDLFKKYNLKLTVFTTGKVLEEQSSIIERLKELPIEFALHSYSHQVEKKNDFAFKCQEIVKAKQAYEKYFGQSSLGYRAPQGFISQAEIEELARQNFKYDCSMFPYWRLGFYNNLSISLKPFRLSSGILEIPPAALSLVRLPISLSYIQFVGWRVYKLLFKILKIPDILIFDLHLHNLKKTRDLKGLPRYVRIFYSRNQDQGLEILEDFIKFIQSRSYKSALLNEILNEAES